MTVNRETILFLQIAALIAGGFTLALAGALAFGHWGLTVPHAVAPWVFGGISWAAGGAAGRLRRRLEGG